MFWLNATVVNADRVGGFQGVENRTEYPANVREHEMFGVDQHLCEALGSDRAVRQSQLGFSVFFQFL